MSSHKLRHVVVVALALFGAAACGAGGDSEDGSSAADLPTLQTEEMSEDAGTDDAEAQPEESSTADGVKDPELAMAEFEKCMQDNGIEIQMAGESGAGSMTQSFETDAPEGAEGDLSIDDFDIEAFEQATAECEQLLDGAFQDFDDLSPEEQAEMADMSLRFDQCMSDQGFDIDADANGAFTLGPETDFEAFEAAAAECQTVFGLGDER